MACGYCGTRDAREGAPCPACGLNAPPEANLELHKLRFLLRQVDQWEQSRILGPTPCRDLRRRYQGVLEEIVRALRNSEALLEGESWAGRVHQLSGALSKLGAEAAPQAGSGEGILFLGDVTAPAQPGPAAPAVPGANAVPAASAARAPGALPAVPAADAPTPGQPRPGEAARAEPRGDVLARLYGHPAPAAPSASGAPGERSVPPSAAPATAGDASAPGTRHAAAVPGAPGGRSVPPSEPGIPPRATTTGGRAGRAAESPWALPDEDLPPAPLEPDVPLGERLRNLLTEQNLRILFNVGLSIFFGGLAIFIRVYWEDYSRAEQVGYLAGLTAAVAGAGFFLRRSELMRTSGSYLLTAAAVFVALDLYAWTRADILPRAWSREIGVVASTGCALLYAVMLRWLGERVLAWLTVIAAGSAYGYLVRILGVDLEHVTAWMPPFFLGLTWISARDRVTAILDPAESPATAVTPAGATPGCTPAGATPAGATPAGATPAGATPAGATPASPAPASPAAPTAPAAPGAPLRPWSALLEPMHWAALGGTPLALVVAFFQYLLASGFSAPSDLPHAQLMLVSAAAHGILVRVLYGHAEVLWPAAVLNGITILLALQHWLPRPEWGPWAMAAGTLGAYGMTSIKERVGHASALPHLSLFYLVMTGALVDATAHFIGQPDPAHAGVLLLTLAWPAAAAAALAVRPETRRYALRSAALLYVEAVLLLVWLGWSWVNVASGAAAIAGLFLLAGPLRFSGALEPFPPALGTVGYAGALLGLLVTLLGYLVRIGPAAQESLQLAASSGALLSLIGFQRKDSQHLAVGLVLFLAALVAFQMPAGGGDPIAIALLGVSLGQAAAAVALAGLGFASARWVSDGACWAAHVGSVVAGVMLGACALERGTLAALSGSEVLGLLGVAYVLHGVRARIGLPVAAATPSAGDPVGAGREAAPVPAGRPSADPAATERIVTAGATTGAPVNPAGVATTGVPADPTGPAGAVSSAASAPSASPPPETPAGAGRADRSPGPSGQGSAPIAAAADPGAAETHEGLALLLFSGAVWLALMHAGLGFTAQMAWLAAPCGAWLALPSFLGMFRSAPYRTAGPAVAMLVSATALGLVLLTPTFYSAAQRETAIFFATTYGVLFAVGSQRRAVAEWFESWRPLLEWPGLLLLGTAFVLGLLWLGIPDASVSIPLALAGAAFVGTQRGTRRLAHRPFASRAGTLGALALWIALGVSAWTYLVDGSIAHGAAALGGTIVVATMIACALVEDPPAGVAASSWATSAAVCFAYPYVSTAFVAFAAPGERILAVAGLSGIYTLVERRARGTRMAVLGPACGTMNVLALLGLIGLGVTYGALKSDASLPSLACALAAGLTTYYAFVPAPPPAFPPVLASTASALLFTMAYALYLVHISKGSNLGGIAFLGSTYVLGIVSLVLRHLQKSPQWKPYFAVSLINAAIAVVLAFAWPAIRAWVLFGLSLLFGGYGVVLETGLFTYLACISLSGAYLSLIQSMSGIHTKHTVFYLLGLAMGKVVAGGFLAGRREQQAGSAGAPAPGSAKRVHPAFHVGLGLAFLSIGMLVFNSSLYFDVEYWLSIGAAWACAVIFLLAWLIARQDLYLYLSAMSVVGSYFVWVQNQDTQSWEWYTLPIGVLGIAWARTLGRRRLDPDPVRTVDVLAIAMTVLPSVLQSFSSLRTGNAALAFVASIGVLALGMVLRRRLYLLAGILGVIAEMAVQVVHVIDFSTFGPIHYFILIGLAVTVAAIGLNWLRGKALQAGGSGPGGWLKDWE